MRAGILLIVLYWALFTIRAGLQPKVAAEVKAATYDMKRASGLEKLEALPPPAMLDRGKVGLARLRLG